MSIQRQRNYEAFVIWCWMVAVLIPLYIMAGCFAYHSYMDYKSQTKAVFNMSIEPESKPTPVHPEHYEDV